MRPLPRLRFSLDELETFLAVAETGSFSKAGDELGLSQPSVSNRIQRLESALGVKLFARTTRMVVLTDAGDRLRGEAERALIELRRLQAAFQDTARERKHTVMVATTPFVASVGLPVIIHRFQAENPSIQVLISDLTAGGARDAVLFGAADLGVMVLDGRHRELVCETLTIDEGVVVAPLGHPLLKKRAVTFDDLRRYPILMPDMYVSVRRLLQREFLKRGVDFVPAKTSSTLNNMSTLLGMVAGGIGITILPRTLIARDRRDAVGTVGLAGLKIVREYRIVTRRGHELSAAARAFIRYLQTSIPYKDKGWP